MGLVHRALLTWFLVTLLLVLIVIRLESKTSWSWFIVFIPMWIFDAIVLTYSTSFVVNRWKRTRNLARSNTGAPINYWPAIVKQRLFFLAMILLKLTGEVLLCVKLDQASLNLPLTYVVVPFGLILIASMISSGRKLCKMATSDGPPDKDTPQSRFGRRLEYRNIASTSTSAPTAASQETRSILRDRRRGTGAGDADGEALPQLNPASMTAAATG